MSHWFFNPDYEGSPIRNDLVLLKTMSNFELNEYVSPACLPEPTEIVEPNHMCYITGFGYMGRVIKFLIYICLTST